MNWYCLHTKPSRELRAEAYLTQTLGLETFLPRITIARVVFGKKRASNEPLFPRYLFCRMDPSVHTRAVRFAPEVSDIVNIGGRAIQVPDSLISDLRTYLSNYQHSIKDSHCLSAGDRVVINFGPLRGLEAIVHEPMSSGARVALLISLLESSARLVIGTESLTRVA